MKEHKTNTFFRQTKPERMYNQGIFIKGYCKGCAVAAKSLQSCLTLCDPIDGRPPGSPVPGILQARTLEWVAISFSNSWKWSRSVVSNSLRPHRLQPTQLLRPWDFPGKSTAVGCHCTQQISIEDAFKTYCAMCYKVLVKLIYETKIEIHIQCQVHWVALN